MDRRVIEFGTPDFDQSLALRKRILRDPLNLQFTTSEIESEYDSIHIGCFDGNGDIVATLTLKPLSADCLKMRQVAVAEGFQRKGIGRELVVYSENWASAHGFGLIELHARDEAVAFYINQKYEKMGSPFTEVGIRHYKMQKVLFSREQ